MPRGLSKLSAVVARGLSSTSVAVRPKKVGIQTRPGRVPDGPGLAYFIAGDGDQPDQPAIRPGAHTSETERDREEVAPDPPPFIVSDTPQYQI